jgi:hypothetical protein
MLSRWEKRHQVDSSPPPAEELKAPELLKDLQDLVEFFLDFP